MLNQTSLLIFAIGASLSGAVFFVALIELLFTVRRRKINTQLEEQLHALKAGYNEQINTLVISDDAKITEVETQVDSITSQAQAEKDALTAAHAAEVEELNKNAKEALAKAKEKAKKLEEEAKSQADDYLKNRQQEVEEDLMDLVMHVTKKVLPGNLTYDLHKELVLEALRDLRAEGTEPGK